MTDWELKGGNITPKSLFLTIKLSILDVDLHVYVPQLAQVLKVFIFRLARFSRQVKPIQTIVF